MHLHVHTSKCTHAHPWMHTHAYTDSKVTVTIEGSYIIGLQYGDGSIFSFVLLFTFQDLLGL